LNVTSKFLSVIIVNWNTRDHLERCLDSISAGSPLVGWQIIVVDNASTDDSVALIQNRFQQVELVQSKENLGFSKGNNLGLTYARGDVVIFLNSDTLSSPPTLEKLANALKTDQSIGVLSPLLRTPSGEGQRFAYGDDPTLGYLFNRAVARLLRRDLHDWQPLQTIEAQWVSGACMCIRRDVLEKTGGFFEGLFMYFEDNDLCKRIRELSLKVIYEPSLSIVHIGGQSAKKNNRTPAAYYQSLRLFYRRHYSPVASLLLSVLLFAR
jgi:N-acetylglucosaminyl-diphospho-decaprenol L-rhamnosyltransferase